MASDARDHGEITISAPMPRAFIEDVALPWLPRLRMYDPARKPRGLGRLRRKLGQGAEQLLHGWLRVPATGRFGVKKSDGSRAIIEFDAHQSAYLAFASRALRGGYEPVETLFLEAMLKRALVFYDVGANWGYYSLLAATHPDFTGKIYAFDISRRMNAELARWAGSLPTDRIEVMGYGLSNRSGTVASSGDRAAHLTTIAGRPGKASDHEVTVKRLDDIALPPPDLMKVDVEDHERELFEGGRRTLRDHHPLILFKCRENGNGGAAGALLRSCGYRLYHLSRRGGADAVIALRPIGPQPAASVPGPSNLVTVRHGDERRWFG